MFCKQCGSKASNDAKFCGKCGVPIDRPETASILDMATRAFNAKAQGSSNPDAATFAMGNSVAIEGVLSAILTVMIPFAPIADVQVYFLNGSFSVADLVKNSNMLNSLLGESAGIISFLLLLAAGASITAAITAYRCLAKSNKSQTGGLVAAPLAFFAILLVVLMSLSTRLEGAVSPSLAVWAMIAINIGCIYLDKKHDKSQ